MPIATLNVVASTTIRTSTDAGSSRHLPNLEPWAIRTSTDDDQAPITTHRASSDHLFRITRTTGRDRPRILQRANHVHNFLLHLFHVR